MTRCQRSLLFALLLIATPAPATGLPDTGQDLCDNGSNVLVACTSANSGDAATYPRQDGRFGRDAKAAAGALAKTGAGAAGFDYTKVANDGRDLAAWIGLGPNPGDWACTRDNVTGLTWEVKVNNPAHLRDWNWTYTWYSSTVNPYNGNNGTPSGTDNCQTAGRCDTEKFVADVNAAMLCGYADWRLPTQREVLTLLDVGKVNPSIDANYYPNTLSSYFWSGSSYVPDPASAWFVYFYHGFTNGSSKANSYYVRLVRGGPF